MDIDMTNGSFRRLSVVDTGRRRRWSEDEKRRIVQESWAAGASASAVAREHGISPSHLFQWRRSLRSSLPLDLGVAVSSPPPVISSVGRNGGIEIIVANGRRIIVQADADLGMLMRVVKALEGA
jgi:transposase